MTREFTAELCRFDSNLWQFHLPVPEEVVKELTKAGNKRVRCTLNGAVDFPAALMKGKEYWYLLVNKKTRTALDLNPGVQVRVQLVSDASEYGHPVPEPLQVLLEQDEEFHRLFHALTKGKQRSLIYLTGTVKNPNSQLNRALAIMSQLKESGGKLDFKQLNEKIKYYNNL